MEELEKLLGLKRTRVKEDELICSCPFSYLHKSGEDKNPSFAINLEKGVYNCFSCGERGTIEDLVIRILGVTYSEAIDLLEDLGFSKSQFILTEEKKEELKFLPEAILDYFEYIDEDLYKGYVENKECYIFPLRDVNGNLVGAYARSKEGRFHKNIWRTKKSDFLYGEDKVEGEPIIIVEGFRDVLSIRKCGYNNVVAIMGAQVSKRQVDKLISLANNFIVWLDKDESGKKGISRISDMLDYKARIVKYVDIMKLEEDEKDPRDVYEKRGEEVVQELIEESKTKLERELEYGL